jgi:hypothetical protein
MAAGSELMTQSLITKLLLARASIMILGSESHGTHDHMLLCDGWITGCCCLAMARVYLPLVINDRLFWLRSSGFQQLRHNIKIILRYSGYAEWAGYRLQISARELSFLRGFHGSPQCSRQIPGQNLKLGQELFYLHSFQLLIH